MDTSANLNLPFIAPAQAQKHITHNEALLKLDTLIHISVVSRSETAPPDSPAPDARYIIGSDPTGAWAGKAGYLTAYQDQAWAFFEPQMGWTVWDEDSQSIWVYHDTAWQSANANTALSALPQLGINASPDDTNRLAVKSDAVLFTHDDITPGSGDLRLLLNKANSGQTVSLLYQSHYSGRAELGLTGEDNFQIKVTADGQNWHDALRIDGETGQVSLPQTPAIAPPFNLLKDSGRFAGSPDPQGAVAGNFTAPSYLSPFNGAAFEAGPQFVHNNSTHGGTRAALDPVVNSLISRLKNANTRRYGIEFHLLKVRTGSGQSGRLDSTNGPHYLSITNRSMPISTQLTVNYHIRVESGSVAIGRAGRVFIDGTETPSAASLITSETGWQQITQLIDYDPTAFAGYHPVLMRIYATADTVYHIAAPIVTPGHIPTQPGQLHGIIPSLDAWR